MVMWVKVYEEKDTITEREKVLLEEYKKVIDIIKNCEELGDKK